MARRRLISVVSFLVGGCDAEPTASVDLGAPAVMFAAWVAPANTGSPQAIEDAVDLLDALRRHRAPLGESGWA
ncbi:MAG: hypothetical protein ACI9U2_000117 [Bradymonadia bacterium]|jgi:hypothetical protein